MGGINITNDGNAILREVCNDVPDSFVEYHIIS